MQDETQGNEGQQDCLLIRHELALLNDTLVICQKQKAEGVSEQRESNGNLTGVLAIF